MFGIKTKIVNTFYLYYCRNHYKRLLHEIRKNGVIKVMFVLSEVSVWKTECLYLKFAEHPRFCAIIGIAPTTEIPNGHLEVMQYCAKKKYDYIVLNDNKKIQEQTDADIVFFQKPYITIYNPNHWFLNNLKLITLVITYGFHSLLEKWAVNQNMNVFSLMNFYENQNSIDDIKPYVNNRNCVSTGIPMMDELSLPKEHFTDVWKAKCQKKRIIWAPHHTIPNMHREGIGYSTFLDYSELMVELANKYRDEVIFAFKPHPLLYGNLCLLWGKEKADNYYSMWKDMDNTQLSLGKYIDLFKYSDAMIHDCSSFTIEYLYAHKPVMYLINSEHHTNNLNRMTTEAFNLHYKGRSKEDIENFIQQVIAGDDPMLAQREIFFADQLTPPHGKTACENIINAILGQEEYSNLFS